MAEKTLQTKRTTRAKKGWTKKNSFCFLTSSDSPATKKERKKNKMKSVFDVFCRLVVLLINDIIRINFVYHNIEETNVLISFALNFRFLVSFLNLQNVLIV